MIWGRLAGGAASGHRTRILLELDAATIRRLVVMEPSAFVLTLATLLPPAPHPHDVTVRVPVATRDPAAVAPRAGAPDASATDGSRPCHA